VIYLREYREKLMQITWKRCQSYAEAKDFSRIIYLHEWNGQPFYWGKAHESFFGGHKRKGANLEASGRYNSGYSHWIEGCLRHGGLLYVGQLDKGALAVIDDVEKYLIVTYGHVMNKKGTRYNKTLSIEHHGEIPLSIQYTRSAKGTVGQATRAA
jgi:hypothetical protein